MFWKKQITAKIKNISIRGRMFLCLVIFNDYLERNGLVDNYSAKMLIRKLEEFTELELLDTWEREINEYNPYSILDDHPKNDFNDYIYLNKEDCISFKKFYLKLSSLDLEMIDNIIEVGRGNIYGGTGSFSSYSLTPTLQVIKKCKDKENLTNAINFAIEYFPFTEENGWGKTFNFKNSFVMFPR